MQLSARATVALGVYVAIACAATAVFSADAMPWWQPEAATKRATSRLGPSLVYTPPLESSAAPIQVTDYTRRYRDGLSTGRAFDAYYGAVQVQAVIRGGRVVAINVLRYPAHSGTSRSINHRALPRLEQEVISGQSADVHAVSGATLTSDAFIRSTGEALRLASG